MGDFVEKDKNLVSDDDFLHSRVFSNISVILKEAKSFKHIVLGFDHQLVVPESQLLFRLLILESRDILGLKITLISLFQPINFFRARRIIEIRQKYILFKLGKLNLAWFSWLLRVLESRNRQLLQTWFELRLMLWNRFQDIDAHLLLINFRGKNWSVLRLKKFSRLVFYQILGFARSLGFFIPLFKLFDNVPSMLQ